MTDLEREELETYRMKSENGQIAAYYLLAEELGVNPGGSVVDTVTCIARQRNRFHAALDRIADEWKKEKPDVVAMAHWAIDALNDA